MKVAIFENEYTNIRASFDAVNLLYFDNILEFDVFQTSQEFGDFKNVYNYSYIIIDIDLSSKSRMDGYQILRQIIHMEAPLPKLIILTGHINMEEQLLERNLPQYPIISKPITFLSIKDALT